jgi:ATPase subunit of ABC transporter with duplicated ATPase domains
MKCWYWVTNAHDEDTVPETVLKGNKPLHKLKRRSMRSMLTTQTRIEKIGELQVQFEEMDGWNADSAAASLLF